MAIVHLVQGGRFVVVRDGGDKIKGGMSGSPIINASGAAVALISTGSDSSNMNPSLMDCLPGWLVARIGS